MFVSKMVAVAAAAVVAGGAGAGALAATGSGHAAASAGSATHSGAKADRKQLRETCRHERRLCRAAALRHSVHASITVHTKHGYVTRSAVRGTVTAKTATSISVKAADGFSETFTLAKTTRVRQRSTDGPRPAMMSAIAVGDAAVVRGHATEGATPTATAVIERATR